MAVIKRPLYWLYVIAFGLAVFANSSNGAVIAEDRADLLYHAYDGGGVTVQGPSLLVRKGFKDKVSVFANYYEDVVSSASIDVISYGSPYREERTEYSLGADYLHKKTMLSLSFSNSTESDYIADTVAFGISQDFFGDMTTLTLGYAQGEDIIRRNVGGEPDPNFEEDAKRRRYSLGLTQVLTKNWIMALSLETGVDDGYLQNPYRKVQYRTLNSNNEYFREEQDEDYPDTRNSDALAIRSMYYLPYRASLRFEARIFSDSWGIEAQNYELRYTHPVRRSLLLEVKARTYDQTKADFFYDLIIREEFDPEFKGRDKELSTYGTTNFGLGLTYTFDYRIPYTKDLKVSAFWDFFRFDYEDFTDQCRSTSNYCSTKPDTPPDHPIGGEPSYGFDANVIRLFLTVNY